jgi:hypothetical protein
VKSVCVVPRQRTVYSVRRQKRECEISSDRVWIVKPDRGLAVAVLCCEYVKATEYRVKRFVSRVCKVCKPVAL